MDMKSLLLPIISGLGLFFGSLSAHGDTLSLAQHGFAGRYYPAQTASAANPVIVLGGSEGGIAHKLAEVIVQTGRPVLAIAYFDMGELPDELEYIPLEYFEQAKTWLQQKHPLAKHITLVGWSKGAELSLLLAAKDPIFNHVVAIAPSSVVWAGILQDWQKTPGSSWTENNTPLPHIAFASSGPVDGLIDLYTQSLANRTDNGQATIPVENIHGSVFLYSGGQDEIWPSNQMAKAVCRRMEKNVLSRCHHFNFPELGHLLAYKFLDQSDPLYQHFTEKMHSN